MQAEGKLKDYQNVVLNRLKQDTKLANTLPSFGNSIFSHAFFVKHSKSWQAHLENIGDYLVHGREFGGQKLRMRVLSFWVMLKTQTINQTAMYATTSDLQHLKLSRNIFQHPWKSVWIKIKNRSTVNCSLGSRSEWKYDHC
jgi:hypothetical protein